MPNILWYCTDQQRFDTIGALGNPHVETPAIDRLVREGVAFTHAYCQSPICTPSRSSYMTGMYPARVHNCRNGNRSFDHHPPLISKLIADAGYDCGMIGKFHLQSSGMRTEPRLDDGCRYWKFSHAPRDDWAEGHDYAEWVREQGGDLNALRAGDDHVPPELHQTKWASDRAIEFLEQDRGDQPWMLTINVYDPHPPFIPPKIYADRFDPAAMPGPHFEAEDVAAQERLTGVDFQTDSAHPDAFDGKKQQALYYAMIAQIDDQFARIVEHLERTGQRENTVIIFSSDHGEMLGDHGLLFKGCRFYEGLVRVPLIFSLPGRFQEDVQSHALVELLDMSATILDLAGVDVPAYFQGRSLSGLLTGEAADHAHRDFVRCEYYDALDAAFIGSGAPDRPAGALKIEESHVGTFGTMYRDGRYKLCVYHGHPVGELFDLENDPWEHNNLWDDASRQQIKCDLLKANFDAAMLTGVDVGTRRIAPM